LFGFFFLGEEKPQPFIPLDLDKQVDGRLVVGNHTSFSPPNGRLPMSSPPLSSHVPQSQSNLIGSPSIPLTLDGGVYQGQPPTQPAIRVIQYAKLNILSLSMNFLFRILDHHLPQYLFLNSNNVQIIIEMLIQLICNKRKSLHRKHFIIKFLIHVQV